MRTVFAKFLAVCVLANAFFGSVSARSPFDPILGYVPDIAVTDIHQESRFVYARVCNLGGTLSDSEDTLVLAMRKAGGGVVSSVVPIVLEADKCHEFQVASLDDLGITTSGMYDISAGAVLKEGRIENNKTNNKFTKSVSIVYPSTNAPVLQNPVYYSPNNYYSNGTYYCNTTDRQCYRDVYPGSTTYYCPATNPSCLNNPYNSPYNGSNTYYRSNICPPGDYACNNNYYNSVNNQYRSDDYYRSCTYSNGYCNNNYYDRNDRHNTAFRQSDLVVRNLYQSSSDKRIVAQICNEGADMNGSASVRTNFTTNGTTSSSYNSIQLSAGQCVDSLASVTPSALGITFNGNYSVTATIDADNGISERNESNNSLTRSFFVETDQIQKPDLVIDHIWSNDNARTITAHICNIGGDMSYYGNWTVEIANMSNSLLVRYSRGGLAKGQCTDVEASYSSLGIYQSGNYNFRVIADPDNAIGEQSKWNNTMNQYLRIWSGY